MLLFNQRQLTDNALYSCFHTSHVTVQLLLSRKRHAQKEFPYIPCYCSTDPEKIALSLLKSFHTSHVTVQRNLIQFLFHTWTCFHTSHVTVQLIKTTNENTICGLFPYIPCYCSTEAVLMHFEYRKAVSIHPMLLFNGFRPARD